jgi:hypothetical protein
VAGAAVMACVLFMSNAKIYFIVRAQRIQNKLAISKSVIKNYEAPLRAVGRQTNSIHIFLKRKAAPIGFITFRVITRL